MEAVQRASGFLFYTFGAILILLVVLVKRGLIGVDAMPYMNILDLPALLITMLYGGSSLYVSLAKGRQSMPLFLAIFVPLGILFVLFFWFNFAVPFPDF